MQVTIKGAPGHVATLVLSHLVILTYPSTRVKTCSPTERIRVRSCSISQQSLLSQKLLTIHTFSAESTLPTATNDVERYMVEYEICYTLLFFLSVHQQALSLLQASRDPDVIGQLMLLLADWYFAWRVLSATHIEKGHRVTHDES